MVMQTIFEIFLGLTLLVVWAAGAYLLLWKWWLQPLRWAVDMRQWGWVTILALGGWIAGLVWLGRHVDDYHVASTFGFTKGDVIVMSGHTFRVLSIDREDRTLRCLHLGVQRATAVLSRT